MTSQAPAQARPCLLRPALPDRWPRARTWGSGRAAWRPVRSTHNRAQETLDCKGLKSQQDTRKHSPEEETVIRALQIPLRTCSDDNVQCTVKHNQAQARDEVPRGQSADSGSSAGWRGPGRREAAGRRGLQPGTETHENTDGSCAKRTPAKF